MTFFYRTAAVLCGLLTAAAFVLVGPQAGLSVLLGGILALINARWMMAGIDSLLSSSDDRVKATTVGFIARIGLIFGVLFAIIHTSFLSVGGVVAGFSVGVAAAFIDGFRHIVWRK